MVYASPAVFIHLLSPTNKLGKNLLRLLFSAHTLLPALAWSSGFLDLHNVLLAACLFATSDTDLSLLRFSLAQ